MTPFEKALAEESRWLRIIPNQPFPNDGITARRVYIGPCLAPRNALRYLTEETRAPEDAEGPSEEAADGSFVSPGVSGGASARQSPQTDDGRDGEQPS
jgi:hypothetical protein